MIQAERVCAVIVTHNRRELLRECLQALLAQERPVDRILVVNNVSTDGTDAMLADEFPVSRFPQLEVIDLPKNVGGAGGFHAGMKRGFADGYDWLWLLDDDTIAQPNALSELLAAHERFISPLIPSLLASKVLWTDGSLHAMNYCSVKYTSNEFAITAAERATLSIRTATFVSLLVHRGAVERYGLPWADYFIWGDDTEFTARVLRQDFGVLVPASIVLHKTARNYGTLEGAPTRFFYHVRNELWMLTRSPAWTTKEKLKRLVALFSFTVAYLRRQRFSAPSLRAGLTGALAGLWKHPIQ